MSDLEGAADVSQQESLDVSDHSGGVVGSSQSGSESTLLSTFRERGWDVDGLTEEDVLSEVERLAEERKSAPSDEDVQRWRALETQYNQVAPHLGDFQEFLRSRSAGAGEPSSVEKKSPSMAFEDFLSGDDEEFDLPSPPQVPAHLETTVAALREAGILAIDPITKLYKSSDVNYAAIAAQANDFIVKDREFDQKFRRNPAELLEKMTRKQLRAFAQASDARIRKLEEQLQGVASFQDRLAIQEELISQSEKFFVRKDDGSVEESPAKRAYDLQFKFLVENLKLDAKTAHEQAKAYAESNAQLFTASAPVAQGQEVPTQVARSRMFADRHREAKRSQNGKPVNRLQNRSVSAVNAAAKATDRPLSLYEHAQQMMEDGELE